MNSTTAMPHNTHKVSDEKLLQVSSKPQSKVDNDGGKRQRSPGKVKESINWSDEPLAKSVLLLQFANEIINIMSEDMEDGQRVDALKATTIDIVASTEVKEAEICDSCDAPQTPEWVRNPGRRPDWSTKGTVVDIEEELTSREGERQDGLETRPQEKVDKDCMKLKDITIEVHPTLLRSWYMAGLRARAAGVGARVAESLAAAPHAVLWSARVPREITSDSGKMMKLSDGRRQCMRGLYIRIAAEVAPLIKSRGLTQYMARSRRLGQVTLVIFDPEQCFRKPSGNGCVGKSKAGHEIDLELAITDLLVSLEMDTVVVHSVEELETIILNYTKAIADESLKLAKRRVDEQAQFYMRGDNKNCVVVDQQGNGAGNLWQQMLAVLPHSSLEVSRALAQHYPAPRALAEGVSCAEGVRRVAEVAVARSGAPGARPRRLGPELADRLRVLFSETDGSLLVG